MTGHLTDTQIRDYLRGDLRPDDLLAVDDHLAGCGACRARASAVRGHAPSVDALLELTSLGTHLSDDEVQQAAAGALPADSVERVDAHIRTCPLCAEQVTDLRAWTQKRSPSNVKRYAAAAAVLVALAVPATWWLAFRNAELNGSLAGLDLLPRTDQERVHNAIAAGVVELPGNLEELAGRREVLMGAAGTPAFGPVAPVGTVIVTDRPLFEWKALAGATGYVVEVFDDELRPVARAPQMTATQWQIEMSLSRGRTFAWQVTATSRGRSVTAPAAPAPAARFRVLDAATAATLENTGRTYPESHLLLGILYAQAGVRAEAERHLRQVPVSDPHRNLAMRSLERLASSSIGK